MSDDLPSLELATNDQLIDELMRRSTFPGVLVYCAGQVTHRPLGGDIQLMVRTTPSVGHLHAAQMLAQGLSTILLKPIEDPK